jgi:hypothetical protein
VSPLNPLSVAPWHQHDTLLPAIASRRVDVNATHVVIDCAEISPSAHCGPAVSNHVHAVSNQDIATLCSLTNLHSASVHNPFFGYMCVTRQGRGRACPQARGRPCNRDHVQLYVVVECQCC